MEIEPFPQGAMTMTTMTNRPHGMADRRKALSPISCRDHRHRPPPPRIPDTPRAGPEFAQNP